MQKFTIGLSFLAGNFIYQYFKIEPDYSLAFEISYFQAIAMIVITIYPEIIKNLK